MRRLSAIATAVVACFLSGPASAASFTHSDSMLPMSDGVDLAATLYEPSGARPPAGWPAVIMFHGLGGTRADTNAIAEGSFASQGYAVLTTDFRGHGQSGGLSSIDGPREITDVRALFDWLAARPEIDAKHIGAWGISLGGGAIWRSLVASVPFAAVETVETWTDLLQALTPQNLSKSGLVAGFLSLIPTSRTDPSVLAVRADALSSANSEALRAFGDIRSSRSALGRITTPALIFQGRRDFAFGLEQGVELYQGLAGPKRLYIGDFGHVPSTFPGPDFSVVMAEASDWFDRYLKGMPNGIDTRKPVELAPDPFQEAQNVSYSSLPPTKTLTLAARGSATIGGAGKVVRSLGKASTRLETFGSGIVRLPVTVRAGWKHLVAVLTATTPSGDTILVSDGGVPTNPGKQTVSIRLLSDATVIPRGSRLTLTVAGSSVAQNPANLLYLATVADDARITIGAGTLRLPVLQHPISG
ncbi:MAG: alpha/beta fold hydrolase [Gaiellaceae bacterium]